MRSIRPKIITTRLVQWWISTFLTLVTVLPAQERNTAMKSKNVIESRDAGARELQLAGVLTTLNATVLVAGSGKSVEAYFTTNDDNVYGPIVFWLKSDGGQRIIIDSIPSVNEVLKHIQSESVNASNKILADVCRALLIRQRLVSGGATGVALVGSYKARFFPTLKNAVSPETLRTLESALEEPSFTEGNGLWRSHWVELDRLGGAEHVIAEGTTKPWAVRKVLRQSILEAGRIPAEILKAPIIMKEH